MKLFLALVVALLGLVPLGSAQDGNGTIVWRVNTAPVEAQILGGPWTLEQSGTAVGLKSAGYCDSMGNQIPNQPNLYQRMEPYYFPSIVGVGRHLQGYFDWRPKDIDEGVVAAVSDDAGFTWRFQQKVLELRHTCPTNPNADPDGDKDFISPNNSDNGDDDGQGHQFVMKVAGHTYLYTLIRANNFIDSTQLAIHELMPEPGKPLNGVPAMSDAPTDEVPAITLPPQTKGLKNPDGILGVVPGVSPLTIIYEQKMLSGDLAFPAAQQCATSWSAFYANNGKLSPNDDVTYLRLATTTDGINFKDLGALQGLHDPTTVSLQGTRWLATAGTILQTESGRYGLLFSGGNCIDADSDSFHYIGYAESTDLIHWTVVNGINNPIVSTAPATVSVDANGVPGSGPGTSMVTIPAKMAVVGNTMGFFQGRVYAPSATKINNHNITVVFAGYHTQKPKNGLGDYRTIGRVSLHSPIPLATVGATGGEESGESKEGD
jgi:hypothetical protein